MKRRFSPILLALLIGASFPIKQVKAQTADFVKNGNNGTVSCNAFCGAVNGNQVVWGNEYGSCSYAKNELTGQVLSCEAVPGLIPQGRQLTCGCMRNAFVKHGNNGTASASSVCSNPEWGGRSGICVAAFNTKTGRVESCDAVPGFLNGPELTSTCSTSSASNSQTFPIETSGTVKGANNKKSMGGGYAEAEATFYRNGLTVIETHSVSNSYTQGTKGSVFVVGSDRKGRALFASAVFDIPTACSKPDTCSSNRRDTIRYQVNSDLAKYIAKIDVYVQDRSGGRSAREAINATIKQTCGTYDDLPFAAKAAIAAETGFSGCGPR